MKLKIVIHEEEEGGYWAEVPAIPGCATQGETFEELLQNVYEAVEACLAVEIPAGAQEDDKTHVMEILEGSVWRFRLAQVREARIRTKSRENRRSVGNGW